MSGWNPFIVRPVEVTCPREVTHPVIATTWTDFSPLQFLSAHRCKSFLRDASVTWLAITRTDQTRVNIWAPKHIPINDRPHFVPFYIKLTKIKEDQDWRLKKFANFWRLPLSGAFFFFFFFFCNVGKNTVYTTILKNTRWLEIHEWKTRTVRPSKLFTTDELFPVHTPSSGFPAHSKHPFRHTPPNSARFGYATD